MKVRSGYNWRGWRSLLTAKLAVPDREVKQLVGFADYIIMNYSMKNSMTNEKKQFDIRKTEKTS